MPTAPEEREVSSDPTLAFPLKGSLKRYPFPRIMREIARNRQTGSLYLLSHQTKKVVFFEEGQPVFVRSNVLSECLGQILCSEGLITSEQCDQTLEAIRRTGKKQGELLVEMGILSEGNLLYGLEAQLRAKLFDIFAWEDGRYQFKADPPNSQLGVRLKLSAEGVIIGAIQDQYTDARARASLEPYLDRYLVVPGGVPTQTVLDLLPEEHYFMSCIDGSHTVAEVLAQQADPPVPTPYALVFGLLQAGVAQLADEAMEAGPPPARPDFNPAGGSDQDLAPAFEPQDVVTEYEDTPQPGELPAAHKLLGDHEADFDSVDVDSVRSLSQTGTGSSHRIEIPHDLVAAEPAGVEETFDEDQIELLDDEVEIVEGGDDLTSIDPDLEIHRESRTDGGGHRLGADRTPFNGDGRGGLHAIVSQDLESAPLGSDLLLGDELDGLPLPDPNSPLSISDADLDNVDLGPVDDAVDMQFDDDSTNADPDELMSFDELDGVDLGDEPTFSDPASNDGPARYDNAEATIPEEDDSPEMVGAIRFNEAETAMNRRDYPRVVTLLEEAYDNGFDVAELHAMLAYARFMAAGQDVETAQHAFELLDYAQNMDPSLDLVHAYRGAIYRARNEPQRAREALERALELNPYCELAMQIMDSLS
jgi:hypothetical protein